MSDFFRKKGKKTVSIYDKILEYFPNFDLERFDLSMYFPNKVFQAKVLFPWCNVSCPPSYTVPEFKKEVWPIFVKDSQETDVFCSPEEYETYIGRRFNGFEKYIIIQENIVPATFNERGESFASHIRLVIDYTRFQNPVLGAALLYNPDISERRSNARHGGISIPLTGNGKNRLLSDFEKKILLAWNIYPENRDIPYEIISNLFEKNSPSKESLFDFCFYSPTSKIGIDIIFGKKRTDEENHFYFLELNHDPDNRILDKTDAWIRY